MLWCKWQSRAESKVDINVGYSSNATFSRMLTVVINDVIIDEIMIVDNWVEYLVTSFSEVTVCVISLCEARITVGVRLHVYTVLAGDVMVS